MNTQDFTMLRHYIQDTRQSRSELAKLTAGLAGIALLVTLGTPSGRKITNEAYNSATGFVDTVKYGDLRASLNYSELVMSYPTMTSAKEIAGGNNMVADWIRKANNLPSIDTAIAPATYVRILQINEKGERLSTLMEKLEKGH